MTVIQLLSHFTCNFNCIEYTDLMTNENNRVYMFINDEFNIEDYDWYLKTYGHYIVVNWICDGESDILRLFLTK